MKKKTTKNLRIALAVVLAGASVAVYAAGSVSLFSGTRSGIIFDAGLENLRIEMVGTDNPILGVSIKGAFSVGHGKVWLGAGAWEYQDAITDTSREWFLQTIETSSIEPTIFVEYEHSSGWLIRATHYEGETSALFKGFKSHGHRPINKYVTKEFSEDLFFIGYKLNF